ncbi:MAG TPA: tRNA pseudouridine(55) synthase TruB [Nitrospiraceae bacterium]|nr:tRNA pseudouridine(55) synthase TruB [Nitrospiraceae bacterium]
MDLVINLDKAEGISSHEAGTQVKKVFNAKKAGHAGTLDPMATGILLVCLNRATRIVSYLALLDKEYVVTAKLGEATDTQDSSGRIISKKEVPRLQVQEIKNVLKSFEGKSLQRPPIFSALKHKGTPLYKLARKGLEVHSSLREINIKKIELENVDLPFITFNVACSKGTYVRALCDDIGKQLGVGAHMCALKRTGVGPFRIEDSIDIQNLADIQIESVYGAKRLPYQAETRFEKSIFDIDTALSWIQSLTVNEYAVKNIRNGSPPRIRDILKLPEGLKTGDAVKVKAPDNELLAIGRFLTEPAKIKLETVFA